MSLAIEKEIIEIAKKYAREKEQRLSELVQNYFKFITTERITIKEEQLSPWVRKLRRIIKSVSSPKKLNP